ncbi:uncharacterized protein LOC122638369 [Telopea speciosissima]|uniref:uncharacterized protein LOC122638369 n=1 Tax=Telopea speciosissima TaxID=54955 RepID=UPI001CC6CCB1|nr:uncharacterized protein LOC122638369 [Telopea speciosissima]XP_043687233.1 uncharacterized protein LOC122638369 [Telopea speciosissima]
MGSYPYGAPPPSEQIWREEVLYLHSLWRKGPPRNPNPKPNSNNLCASNSSTPKPTPENLCASNPTTFKKKEKKRSCAKKNKDPKPIVSEVEWPSDTEPCQEIGWPESNPQSDQATRAATAEEQAKSIGLCASNSSTPKPTPEKLCASNSTTFKKRKNKQRGAKKKKDPKPIVSEVEWPCGSDPEPCQEIGWSESNPQSDQATRAATAEEQAKSTGLYLQQKVLKVCQDFFSSKVCTDDNGEEEELMDDDINESEEFKFFMGIFTDDSYLRDYYEKSWERGEFSCLVCGGTGKKLSKKFKNCVALVQHSTTISKRKAAHRAFGKAICQVLDWEIHRLPKIVPPLDRPLGRTRCMTRSMAKAESQVIALLFPLYIV